MASFIGSLAGAHAVPSLIGDLAHDTGALSVPAGRSIKPVYVRSFVALIDAVKASDQR
ncbi:MAG: hypothetical protein JO312_05445 [Hyphomicrobiales bacterium]|nr:hypothetical protein [Hyphomicrobiales bacterium]